MPAVCRPSHVSTGILPRVPCMHSRKDSRKIVPCWFPTRTNSTASADDSGIARNPWNKEHSFKQRADVRIRPHDRESDPAAQSSPGPTHLSTSEQKMTALPLGYKPITEIILTTQNHGDSIASGIAMPEPKLNTVNTTFKQLNTEKKPEETLTYAVRTGLHAMTSWCA